MSARRLRQDDVLGYLNQRPIAQAVRIAFGQRPNRFLVQRIHAERYGIRPDPVQQSSKEITPC